MSLDRDEILNLLSDDTSWWILQRLKAATEPLSVTELAEDLVRCDIDIVRTSEYESEVETAKILLHHDKLPRLDRAGVIEYDAEENVATHNGNGSLSAVPNWRGMESINELLADFSTVGPTDDQRIGVIDNRKDIVTYGRRLTDEADEELFLMFVSEKLLKEGCFSHGKEAVNRGVDVCIGTQSKAIRDKMRHDLPGVTVWEPQLDWLNARSSCPKIGRLFLADREKVMLTLIDEADDSDGAHLERAMVGMGADNPLVVLVRELLGPRLDHLDYQSDSFRSQLPF